MVSSIYGSQLNRCPIEPTPAKRPDVTETRQAAKRRGPRPSPAVARLYHGLQGLVGGEAGLLLRQVSDGLRVRVQLRGLGWVGGGGLGGWGGGVEVWLPWPGGK